MEDHGRIIEQSIAFYVDSTSNDGLPPDRQQRPHKDLVVVAGRL